MQSCPKGQRSLSEAMNDFTKSSVLALQRLKFRMRALDHMFINELLKITF